MVLKPPGIEQTRNCPDEMGCGEKVFHLAHLRIHLSRLFSFYVLRRSMGVESRGRAVDKTLLRGTKNVVGSNVWFINIKRKLGTISAKRFNLFKTSLCVFQWMDYSYWSRSFNGQINQRRTP